MSIHVHIERLIVEGVDIGPSGAVDLQSAIRERLTQLLTERGITRDYSRTTWIPAVEGQPLSITRPMHGATLGNRVAESLHRGFQNQGSRPETIANSNVSRG